MNLPAASTSAEGPAPNTEREVFVRDHDDDAKRVPLHVADRLVTSGVADRVSAAGHVRLKPGFKIKALDSHSGAGPNVTTIGRTDRKSPHPRCLQWTTR
jgi:hypothetical protein